MVRLNLFNFNCSFGPQVFKYCVLKFVWKVPLYANLRPENLSFDPLVVACRRARNIILSSLDVTTTVYCTISPQINTKLLAICQENILTTLGYNMILSVSQLRVSKLRFITSKFQSQLTMKQNRPEPVREGYCVIF